MRNQFARFAVRSSLALYVALGFSSVSFGVADLSGWLGAGNTDAPNNYTIISSTSAGGTFQSRKSPTSTPPPPENWYLRDDALTGGPLGFDDPLSLSGSITLANPNNADPSWFFGWYSSTDLRFRLGISAADSATDFLRMQANYGNGGTITSSNLTTDGTNTATLAKTPAPAAGATYNFTFAYTPGPSNNLTVHLDPGGTDWRRVNLTLNFATADKFDRFGFLQLGNAAADLTTFDVTVSNITYTGETAVGGGSVPGDYNGNGTVDAADYVLWRDGNIAADGSGPVVGTPDGIVNSLDYDFWQSRFGATSGSGSGVGAVPEPTTATLALLCIGLMLAARGRTGTQR